MTFGVGVGRLHRPLIFALQATPLLLRCFARHVRQSVIMAIAPLGMQEIYWGFDGKLLCIQRQNLFLRASGLTLPSRLPISSQL
jgi:hypothetical protein